MKYLLTAFLLLVSSCSYSSKSEIVCDKANSHTLLASDAFNVFIYNPDNIESPEIWEGPLCVQNIKTKSICNFDESLIKTVSFLDKKNLAITTFSGSNSTEWELNLTTCQHKQLPIKNKSDKY